MLDQATVRDLAMLTDDIGVLSIYSTADPREESTSRPARRLRLENELRALRQRISEGGKRLQTAVFPRLEKLQPELERLLASAEHGVGRALFAPVGRDEIHTVSIQMPLGDLAVLRPAAYVRPLVAASATGSPAGVLAVGREGIRMVDLRYEQATDAGSLQVDVDTVDWARMQGPRASSPGTYASSHSQNDLYDRRLEDHQIRSLVALAPRIDAKSKELGWDTVVLTGDPRIVEPLAANLLAPRLPANGGRHVLQLEQHADSAAGPSDLADAVAPKIAAARARRTRELVTHALDKALSGGPGAVGLRDALAALQEGGRVRHLMLDQSRDWQGHRAPDGRVYALGEVPPGVSAGEMTGEDELGERMIELAMAGGGDVTMLNAGAGDLLADYDGIAALLRW